MMATDRSGGNRSGFLDGHVATGFDPPVPVIGDLQVGEAHVTTAFRALAGLRLSDGVVNMPAAEAADLARWLLRVEQSHEKRPLRRSRGATAEHGLGFDRFRSGLGIAVLPRFGETCDGVLANDSSAVFHLEIRAAATTLGRDHQSGLYLSVPTFRASHLDAMALGLIGHGWE